MGQQLLRPEGWWEPLLEELRQTGKSAAAPAAPISQAYAGTYRSDELQSSFTVTVVGETIQVKLPTGATATMRQTKEGVFVGGGTTMRFDPIQGGTVPGFVLDLGRVRGLRFVRTP